MQQQRYTTHHASRPEAREAAERQRNDLRYPAGATFEDVQTNVGEPEKGTTDRFAVQMSWTSEPSCPFHPRRAQVRNGMCGPCAEKADDAR